MTTSEAVERLIAVAKDEIGYLEKASASELYDKTANAGSANYTKYWADIKPSYQGQPWCACFVTWCFVQAFGRDNAEKLLKHYPYVYCPTLGTLFTKNANPTVGDVVIFYSSSAGRFSHTGIVTSVSGDYFRTVEGNTSGGSSVIANGGGVCAKGYYNSNLPGTKFCTPDYSLLADYAAESEDDMTEAEVRTIAQEEIQIAKAENMIYNYIDSNMPDWARPTIQKLVGAGILQGDENGELGLTDEMLRLFVVLDRTGVFN